MVWIEGRKPVLLHKIRTKDPRILGVLLSLALLGLYLSACSSSKNTSDRGSGSPLPPPSTTSTVTTYHNDNGRTGQNLNETTLTPGNVSASNFGLLFVIPVDGKVDAQPLYLPNLRVAGASHNV